ncbi:MAG: arylsulfatase [Betaproteobacteria bacterium]|nr:arylsulfatase [Betaproteobacteria bacterium]
MTAPRIALVHATPLAIAPIVEAFRKLWPEARTTNLLEDSLSGDLAAAGAITPAIVERFVTLTRYCEGCGADAVLFTCSAFGTAIDAAKRAARVPVLKPNEAMLEEALGAGRRIALLATFEPSIPWLKIELEDLAAHRGTELAIQTRAVPAAITALQKGHADEHDRLIVAAAAEFSECDAVVLGQFSMARAAAGIPARPGRKVLTSPASAVVRLRQLFQDAARTSGMESRQHQEGLRF